MKSVIKSEAKYRGLNDDVSFHMETPPIRRATPPIAIKPSSDDGISMETMLRMTYTEFHNNRHMGNDSSR